MTREDDFVLRSRAPIVDLDVTSRAVDTPTPPDPEWRALLREAIEVVHQTESIRRHSDPNDKTGWNVHGIETCADPLCVASLAALATPDPSIPERPAEPMSDTEPLTIEVPAATMAAIMDGHGRIESRLARSEVLAAAAQKVIDAVRSWRDAGADPLVPRQDRVLWQEVVAAEWTMLAAISDYEAAVEGDPDGAAVALAYMGRPDDR